MSTTKTLNLLEGEGGYKVVPGCGAVLLNGRIVDLKKCSPEDAAKLAAMPNCDQVTKATDEAKTAQADETPAPANDEAPAPKGNGKRGQ